jgi:hypothetical protein
MDKHMYHYATVSQALSELTQSGFTIDYNIEENQIFENPNNFKIVHIYRYEGNSDPDDEAHVYGIENSNGEKGVFVAGLSTYSESNAAKILHQLSIKSN